MIRHRVVFVGQRLVQVADVPEGTSLLAAIVRARLPIGRSCRGQGVCFACRVAVEEGAPNLSPRTTIEDSLTDRARLACRARVHGPLTITTPYW